MDVTEIWLHILHYVYNDTERVWIWFNTRIDLITRFMGPTWGPPGAHLWPTGPRWAPCGPREPCYLAVCLSNKEVRVVMLDNRKVIHTSSFLTHTDTGKMTLMLYMKFMLNECQYIYERGRGTRKIKERVRGIERVYQHCSLIAFLFITTTRLPQDYRWITFFTWSAIKVISYEGYSLKYDLFSIIL